ncbi:MAG: RidA family protein [Cyclobacteriaceae bacterium]|nr:RidA family protein [Cyclobacteriaceae bacterium]
MTAEQRFEKLGLTLPASPDPLGVYKLLLIDGNHALVSGHGTLKEDGTWIVGKVGQDMDADAGKLAAQQVGLAILATLRKYLGSLDRVERVIKLLGMVNCVPDFTRHPFVINGCSELFANVWGEDKGVGVRSAVGMSSLPEGIPVEIEVLFKLN